MVKRKRETPERRAKREAERERKRQDAEARKAAQAMAQAELEERAAERIAPAIQRNPVVDPSGNIIRAPRLERDGSTFKRSSPLVHLAKRSGETPTINGTHLGAAKRLLDAWDLAGDGVGLGASNYGERTGSGGHSGLPSDGGMIWLQIEAQREIAGAHAFLGALWPAILSVVLRGMDVTAWAAIAKLRREVALGFLLAALERLVEFYKPRATVVSVGIRAAIVAPIRADTQLVDSDAAS